MPDLCKFQSSNSLAIGRIVFPQRTLQAPAISGFRLNGGQSFNNQKWCNFRIAGDSTGTQQTRKVDVITF